MTACKAAKQYVRKVERHLTCSRKNRIRIMKIVRHAVDAYLEDEPQAEASGLISAFGEPKAFAESLLSKVPASEIESARKARRFRFRSSIIALISIVAISLIMLSGFYLKYQDTLDNGIIVNYSSTYYPEGTSKEEAMKFAEIYMDEIMEGRT